MKKEIVVICGWCPGARELTIQIVKQGKAVSHTVCPACVAKLDAELETK